LPDLAKLESVLDTRAALGPLPVLFYGDETDAVAADLQRRLDSKVTSRSVHSRPRLIDQATLFLHCELGEMSAARRAALTDLHESQRALAGKKVLIVDDDMRNIFALATVLDEQGMVIVSADNGREAIEHVRGDPRIDVVLMDIMMPEMDGIATIQEIRKIPECRDLPIIAVTAKAMKGDREKCIEAGAWDYLSKPVDTMDLLAVLRAWLHQSA
jgi:CheY-like chemotaxis protein